MTDQDRPAWIGDAPLVIGELLNAARAAMAADDPASAHRLIDNANALVDELAQLFEARR